MYRLELIKNIVKGVENGTEGEKLIALVGDGTIISTSYYFDNIQTGLADRVKLNEMLIKEFEGNNYIVTRTGDLYDAIIVKKKIKI